MDAVVPVAGRGTRLLPLTRVVPKELLPLDGRPIIEHVVAELRGAGVERICLVTRPGKAAVEDQFDDPDIVTARQPEPRGLGDAILCAREFCGDAPFVVALGDCVFRSPAVVRALLEAPDAAAVLAVERVADHLVSRYGIVATDGDRVLDVVEKPAPRDAPGNLAVAGRYVLSARVFDALREVTPDAGGEIGLSPALAALARGGERVLAVELPPGERRYDIGDLQAYSDAFVEFAAPR
jgi:UTP--glucose-1-phosphate uridylyltransferase